MNIIRIVLNYILRASEYDLVKTRGDVLYEAYISSAHRVDDLTAERDYLDARCAEFEDFASDFIELEYDNVLRERLEKILYNGKDGE